MAVQPVSHDAPEPAPASRTLVMRQSRQRLPAISGQPTTVAQLAGGKRIDYFPTMKVTFIARRASAVQ